MKHVKKTCFQIRQESNRKQKHCQKLEPFQAFIGNPSSSIQDSYVTLQTETARMENIRAEPYFVQVMVIPRSQTSKNQENPTPTNQNQQTN